MRFGRIIFDGEPVDLTNDAMDDIYAGVPAEERGDAESSTHLREVAAR